MDLSLDVDLDSGTHRHKQVYDAIRTAILTGRLRPGERLPPTRSLAEQLSLSRTTIAEAYDQLQAEGYVHGRAGSGTYVAPDLPKDALQPARRPSSVAEGREVRLSPWGKHLQNAEYRSLLRDGQALTFPFDLRPHGVASDSFPWDSWSRAVERAVDRERSRLMLYPPSAGHPGLREAIAAHIAKYRAVTCSPDDIVIVNGSLQGLNLLAQLLLDRGDVVALEDPGYPAARLAFEAHELAIRRVPVDSEGMMVEELRSCSPARLIHVTASHQEPTGATLSLARRLTLLEIAERTNSVILEDDYDSEFRYEGRPVESLQGLDRQGLVVYAGTFSKSVLAGLRIGFLVLPPHLLDPFVAAKSLWDSGAPLLEQAALAEFMHSGDFERHIRRMRRLYRSRRDSLVAALFETFGDRVTIGERHGGLNVLISLEVGLSEESIVRQAAAAGVGLRGASRYYSVPPANPTFLLGFAALPEQRVRSAVQALADAVSSAPTSLRPEGSVQ